jgi:hypothetical protein
MKRTPQAPLEHLDDVTLARFVDGALRVDEAPAVEAHLALCVPCGTALEALQGVRASLAEAPSPRIDMAARVWRRVDDAQAKAKARRAPWGVPAFAAGAACAALVVFVVARPDEFGARGSSTTSPVLRLFLQDGAKLAPVVAGQTLGVERVRLAAGVAALPSSLPPSSESEPGRSVAVYARDARGRVTWLRPTWADGASPACEPVGEGPVFLLPAVGVDVDAARGKLEVGLVLVRGTCNVAVLDERLERGASLDDVVDKGNVLARERLELVVE